MLDGVGAGWDNSSGYIGLHVTDSNSKADNYSKYTDSTICVCIYMQSVKRRVWRN